MNLRKTRIVQCGAQNTDFRVDKDKSKTEDNFASRLEFISTHKSKRFSDIEKERQNRKGPDPIKETKTFYNTLQKGEKNKIPMFSHQDPQEKQLNEKEDTFSKQKLDGDSFMAYTRKPKFVEEKGVFRSLNKKMEEEKLRQQYLEYMKRQKEKKDKKEVDLIKYKHDQHASAIQETQLVGLANNQDTLEGKVDLDKVREIRKALRRRYANRKNFQKIFNAWDEDHTGQINVVNSFNMIKKMGININIDEVRVLVASADENNDGKMDMDEFMNLIFNDNQGLNVNLSEIPVLTKEEMDHMMKNESLFQGDKNIKKIRHDRQLSMILKNKLASLTSHLVAEDAEKHGFVNIERLEKVLRKLSIPPSIINEDDVKMIFEKYKVGDYKFDYNKFVNELQQFEFNPEEISKQKQEKQTRDNKELSYIQKMIQQFTESELQDPPIHVQDVHTVDSSALERYAGKKFKMETILRRYFPEKKSFDDFLMHQLGIHDEKLYKQTQISSGKLSNIIEDIMLNFGERVQNNDIQGFLSAFVYNQYKQTPCTEVSRQIYEEDLKDWEKKLQFKNKKPPPPKEHHYHPDFPIYEQFTQEEIERAAKGEFDLDQQQQQSQEELQEVKEQTKEEENGDAQPESKRSEGNINNTEENAPKSQQNLKTESAAEGLSEAQEQENQKKTRSSLDLRNTHQKTNSSVMFEKLPQFASTSYWRQSGFNSSLSVDVKSVLKKFEDQVFCGTKRAYDVYKSFDTDKDGYVSQKDLVNQIQHMDVLNKNETKTLLKHLFPDPSKAYLNFTEFSASLRAGVLDNDTLGNPTVVSFQQPSKEAHEDYMRTLPLLKATKEKHISRYDPDNELNYMKASRFGASPGFKNTFRNFNSSKNSGMYIDDGQRFDRSHNHRVQFQVEEKNKKMQIENAKIERRKWYSQQITDRYVQQQAEEDRKRENNRMTKGMCQWTYEHRCHLKNNWQ